MDDGRLLLDRFFLGRRREGLLAGEGVVELLVACLLYTSDAADE